MRRIVLICILVLAVSAAKADSIGAGVGVQSCGQFSSGYETNQANEVILSNWTLGFMTGMNVILEASNMPTRQLDAMTSEERKGYIRTYCDLHPLRYVMDGALELFGKLPVSK
jgi:hypothetical protein